MAIPMAPKTQRVLNPGGWGQQRQPMQPGVSGWGGQPQATPAPSPNYSSAAGAAAYPSAGAKPMPSTPTQGTPSGLASGTQPSISGWGAQPANPTQPVSGWAGQPGIQRGLPPNAGRQHQATQVGAQVSQQNAARQVASRIPQQVAPTQPTAPAPRAAMAAPTRQLGTSTAPRSAARPAPTPTTPAKPQQSTQNAYTNRRRTAKQPTATGGGKK